MPHLGDPADLGQIVGGLDVGNLGQTVGGLDVGNLGGTVGAIGSGNIDGILNAVGADAGNLVDGLLDTVAGDGSVVGNLLNTLGPDVLNGAVGGTGLLDGTPLEGLQGDGGLLSGNIMRDDDSSSSSTAQVGVGNDPSDGLINVDAASDRSTSESNHVINTDVGPQTSGNGINADDARNERYFTASANPGHAMFDLNRYTVDRLARTGVAASMLDRCTYADEELFYSYRRATHRKEADYGRQISAIVLEKN